MRNVEGVGGFEGSEVRSLRLICKPERHDALSRARTQDNIVRQAAVGVLSLRRALYYLEFLLSRERGLFLVYKRVEVIEPRDPTPPTLRMGLLLYTKGVTDRWQHRGGYKRKK